MRIGFAQVDITPPLGSLMCGQLFEYRAQGVESKLFASAMCIDDEQTPILIVSCDVLIIMNDKCAAICAKASEVTGVPADNIMVCTTHTHSGPYTVDVFGSCADAEYLEDLESKIVKSLMGAYESRTETRLRIATGRLPGWAFNRRFLMSDGTIQTHPLKLDPHIVKAEGPDSTHMFVFYAEDINGKPMGTAVNFGCHATTMERNNNLISSDWPGKMSEYIAKAMGNGTTSLLLQGCCGNICQVNPLDDSNKETGLDWCGKMGRAVGQKAMDLIENESTETSGPIRVITKTIEIPRRAIDPELVLWAKSHKSLEAEVPRLSDYGTARYDQLPSSLVSLSQLFSTPFWANFYANEIKALDKLRTEQPHMSLTLKVITQDNWAMVALPAEVFVEWGELICDNSPFEYTSVVELANGWNGYIPTKEAFQRKGGYETKEVTSTMLIPEAGNILVEAVTGMLKEAKGAHAKQWEAGKLRRVLAISTAKKQKESTLSNIRP